MKFFGKEVPPRKAEAGREEYGIRPEEPIFRPKPESPLDVRSLVEKAKAGEAIDMVPELDEYFDGWLHYAQDRNLFSGTGEMQAMAQARREAIKLASEKKYEELEAKLEELSGPLAENVERAADANLQRIQGQQEATSKEHKDILANAVNGLEELKLTSDEVYNPQDPVHRKAMGLSNEVPRDRHAERERRAEVFAEKYGIATEREALLTAEQNYADAIRHRNESFFKLEFRDDAATKGQREILEEAIQKWREALANAGGEADKSGEKQDALSARFIGARDAMMRIEQVRQRSVAEGLDNRSKTTIGKFDAWANKLNSTLFKGMASAGRGFGKASEAVGGLFAGLVFDKEEDAEKYQRASRIIGSAAIMTAVFAPFGAATAGAAGMMFVMRSARGLGGWVLGSSAGYGAGKIYDLKHGTKERRLETHEISQKDLLSALKDGRIEVLDQKAARQLYKEGSVSEFTKSERAHAETKARVETAASALVAGASAYGLAHLPPVHEALTNHPVPLSHPEAHAPAVEHHAPAHHAPSHPEAHHAPVMPPAHVESVTVHGNVNDADKLFGRFLDNVKEHYPNPQEAPPALRTLLEQYHHVDGTHQQDVLTKFLHLQNGGSVVVHPGDTLSYENGKVIFQGHTLIDEHGSVHNLREGGQVHIEHPHLERQHVAHAANVAPEQEPTQPASPSIQPGPSTEPIAQPAPQAAPVSPPPAAPPSAVEAVPAPEHVAPPAPETAPIESEGPHIIPNDHVSTPEPINHPLPSNDNIPIHVPTPESHAVPVSPEVTPSIIHNAFGIDVDSKTTHIYQLHQPGSDNPNVLVAYGGSLDDRLRTVQQYLAQPENVNKVVFVTGTQADPTTHNLMTNPWKYDAVTKQVNPGFVFTDQNGLVPPPPGPDDLQKIIS